VVLLDRLLHGAPAIACGCGDTQRDMVLRPQELVAKLDAKFFDLVDC
jgi:prolyl-tRNA editing enzyme YbaK/EbsC (Cys-tRNA(Pro) deacylase)